MLLLLLLYCRLLADLLEPHVYYAQLAGTAYSLSPCETGLVLQVQRVLSGGAGWVCGVMYGVIHVFMCYACVYGSCMGLCM